MEIASVFGACKVRSDIMRSCSQKLGSQDPVKFLARKVYGWKHHPLHKHHDQTTTSESVLSIIFSLQTSGGSIPR